MTTNDLRAQLEALRAELDDLKAYVLPRRHSDFDMISASLTRPGALEAGTPYEHEVAQRALAIWEREQAAQNEARAAWIEKRRAARESRERELLALRGDDRALAAVRNFDANVAPVWETTERMVRAAMPLPVEHEELVRVPLDGPHQSGGYRLDLRQSTTLPEHTPRVLAIVERVRRKGSGDALALTGATVCGPALVALLDMATAREVFDLEDIPAPPAGWVQLVVETGGDAPTLPGMLEVPTITDAEIEAEARKAEKGV